MAGAAVWVCEVGPEQGCSARAEYKQQLHLMPHQRCVLLVVAMLQLHILLCCCKCCAVKGAVAVSCLEPAGGACCSQGCQR